MHSINHDNGNSHLVYQDDERDGDILTIHVSQLTALPFTVRAAIKLGIPDILKEAGPDAQLTAGNIASRIATPKGSAADSENLDRLLRLLASHNVVRESVSISPKDPNAVERRYCMTPSLEYLTSRDGGSVAGLVLCHTASPFVSTLEYLHETVVDRNAQPFVFANGKGIYEYLATDNALDKQFNRAMTDSSTFLMSKLLHDQTYKGFEGLSLLVDVGGATGTNLALILSKYPHLRGINFDLPHVVAKGVEVPKLEHVGGDFFETVPEGDAIFMKWIMHNWKDELCVKILQNIAKALPPHGKVINMDVLLPEVSDSSLKTQSGLSFDILMMGYCNGGKERTLGQFKKIAAAAGFPRVEVVATVSNLTVLEFYKS